MKNKNNYQNVLPVLFNLLPLLIISLQLGTKKYGNHNFEIFLWLLIVFVPYYYKLFKLSIISEYFLEKTSKYSLLILLIILFQPASFFLLRTTPTNYYFSCLILIFPLLYYIPIQSKNKEKNKEFEEIKERGDEHLRDKAIIYIKNNQTEKALSILEIELKNNENKNFVILQQSRFRTIHSQFNGGLISEETLKIEVNKIKKSILDLVVEIEIE